MDGHEANTTISDLVGTKGSVLIAAKENISALFQPNANPEQSGRQEHSPDRVKTISNDVMKSELQFNKAHSAHNILQSHSCLSHPGTILRTQNLPEDD